MGSNWIELDRELPFPGAPSFTPSAAALCPWQCPGLDCWQSPSLAAPCPAGLLPTPAAVPGAVKAGWDTVVHSYYPTVQNGGMEKMTIAFE